MPPKPRTPEEKQRDKQRILDAALEIVQQHGLSGLTIRKLSSKLKMSGTNIYNYFYNKDEIYLHILMAGFELQRKNRDAALEGITDPLKRLEITIRTFIRFSKEHPAYYQLMFCSADPKSLHYTGTPLEALAKQENDIVLRAFSYFQSTLTLCDPSLNPEELRMTAMRLLCQVHGLISLYISNNIQEIHIDFDDMQEILISHILSEFRDRIQS